MIMHRIKLLCLSCIILNDCLYCCYTSKWFDGPQIFRIIHEESIIVDIFRLLKKNT